MAVDFSRFVLRMYVLSLCFLGTVVDFSRFVLRMYVLSVGFRYCGGFLAICTPYVALFYGE